MNQYRKHICRNFVATVLMWLLVLSTAFCPMLAYGAQNVDPVGDANGDARFGDGMTNGRNVHDWDGKIDWNDNGTVTLPPSFGDCEEQVKSAANPYLTAAEMSTAAAWTASIVGSTLGPGGKALGSALAFGFGWFSSWAANQDLSMARAYGPDYALSDFLIQLYREGEANYARFDHSKEYTIEEREKNPDQFVEGLDGATYTIPQPDTWKFKRKVKPWDGKEDFIVPAVDKSIISYFQDSLFEEFKDKFKPEIDYWGSGWGSAQPDPGLFGEAKYRVKEAPFVESKVPAGTHENRIFRYDYTIAKEPLDDELLSLLQAIIYHLVGNQDWRMMMAEAHRRGSDLTADDFQYSIQKTMGFELNGNIIDGLGLLLMGKNGSYDGHNLRYTGTDLITDDFAVPVLDAVTWTELAKDFDDAYFGGYLNGSTEALVDRLVAKGFSDSSARAFIELSQHLAESRGESVGQVVGTVGKALGKVNTYYDRIKTIHKFYVQDDLRQKNGDLARTAQLRTIDF